jgi:hypothetical protein
VSESSINPELQLLLIIDQLVPFDDQFTNHWNVLLFAQAVSLMRLSYNEFKERSNQVDNRQSHISFDMFWFIAQTEMK